MTMFQYSAVAQWLVIVVIITGAFMLPEPRYVEVMQGGPWTREKAAAEANNRLIYALRFIRRGFWCGLVFGTIAGVLTALVWAIR